MEEEIPKQQTDQEKIAELNETIENLQFLSDPVRFNQVLYQGLNLILKKLSQIEERLQAIEKK